ncbi:unnamed protein product [Durusdinium trenchii]|uniref:Uncharacterized protein n=1 Tax=Durusdinium trenchii TaxID=1381693 RepID=A0ABP0MIH7_9DINO
MSLGQPGAATWPLVFLDVDGVLTTSEELLTAAASHVPLRASCVRNLATVIERTGAKIVVSSTWRNDGQLYEHLLNSLEMLGGHQLRSAVLGGTPSLPGLGRGFEIALWLEEQKRAMSSLVIFEDSVSHHRSIEAAGLAGFLVKTQLGVCCLQEGLTEDAAQMALQLLESSNSLDGGERQMPQDLMLVH